MFIRLTDKDGKSYTPFSLAGRVASMVMRGKVTAGSKTQICVLLWGTRSTKNANNFENCYEVVPLEEPSPRSIALMETLEEDANTPARAFFEKDYGSMQTGNASIDTVLWLSDRYFNDAKLSKYDSRRIWILTNDDDPCGTHADVFQRATQRIAQNIAANVTYTLWTLTNENDLKYDFDRFWRKAIVDTVLKTESEASSATEAVAPRTQEEIMEEFVVRGDSYTDLGWVRNAVRKKENTMRAMTTLSMILASNVEIGVRVYLTAAKARIPSAITVDSETGRPVSKISKVLCIDTISTSLTRDQIVSFIPYGSNGLVAFSEQDKANVRRFAPPSIAVLGFKPMRELLIWQNMQPPYFVRPDEATFSGSTKAFVALLSEVKSQNMFIAARLIVNRISVPKLVALIPQTEVLSQDGKDVIIPYGFVVVVLPFAEDVRLPQFDHPFGEADSAQIETAKKLIGYLELAQDYDPRDYQNPALQKFFQNLEALATDKREGGAGEDGDAKYDVLKPTEEQMESMVFNEELATAGKAFNDSFGGCELVPPAKPKRPAAPRTKGEPAKKRVKEEGEVDFEKHWKAGTLKSLTVEELKIYLRVVKLPLSGTKGILVARLEKHFAQGGGGGGGEEEEE